MPWYFDSVCVFSLLGPVYFAGLQAKRSDPTRETSHALERVATERIATDCPCTWFIRPGEQHQGLLVITSGIGMKRAHGSPIKEYESMQHRRLTDLFLKSTTCLVLVFSSQITLGSQWIFACLLYCPILHQQELLHRLTSTLWPPPPPPPPEPKPKPMKFEHFGSQNWQNFKKAVPPAKAGLLFPVFPFLRVTFRKREMGVESLGLSLDPCIMRASFASALTVVISTTPGVDHIPSACACDFGKCSFVFVYFDLALQGFQKHDASFQYPWSCAEFWSCRHQESLPQTRFDTCACNHMRDLRIHMILYVYIYMFIYLYPCCTAFTVHRVFSKFFTFRILGDHLRYCIGFVFPSRKLPDFQEVPSG